MIRYSRDFRVRPVVDKVDSFEDCWLLNNNLALLVYFLEIVVIKLLFHILNLLPSAVAMSYFEDLFKRFIDVAIIVIVS